MEAGLKEFMEAYAKDKQLTQTEAGMLAGALAYKSIQRMPGYAEFILTLGMIAPQLLAVVEMANNAVEDN